MNPSQLIQFINQSSPIGIGVDEMQGTIDYLVNQSVFEFHELSLGAYLFSVNRRTDDCDFQLRSFDDFNGKISILKPISIESIDYKNCSSNVSQALEILNTKEFKSFCLVKCKIIGSLYVDTDADDFVYRGDSFYIGSAHKSVLLYPSEKMLISIIEATLNQSKLIEFGKVKFGEGDVQSNINVSMNISIDDIVGKRTAMFGKTRMGKSNSIKLIVQGVLETSKSLNNVGQIIFDVNGEYANVNPQDSNSAIASAFPDRCISYFLIKKDGNLTSRLLRFNFYESPEIAPSVMKALLPPHIANSDYASLLFTLRLPSILKSDPDSESLPPRLIRKIMLYWCLLYAAGFDSNSESLRSILLTHNVKNPFNPGFGAQLRFSAYQAINNSAPSAAPSTFEQMTKEFDIIINFLRRFPNDPSLLIKGESLFDSDEEIMIEFMRPPVGVGPYILRPILQFHSPEATDHVSDIINFLDEGKTVIIDLAGANEQIIKFFARNLSESLFRSQELKFTSNKLAGRYIQIYFEEAHMIFPPNQGMVIDIYSRFAKEGAKYNIGIVYSTQSPLTINNDLLSQTENFFIGHLSSRLDTSRLSETQYAFSHVEDQILRQRCPGFLHILTFSHRFVVPVQANRYSSDTSVLRLN